MAEPNQDARVEARVAVLAKCCQELERLDGPQALGFAQKGVIPSGYLCSETTFCAAEPIGSEPVSSAACAVKPVSIPSS